MNGMKADYIRIPRTHIRHSCIQFHINIFQLPRARFSLSQNEQNEKNAINGFQFARTIEYSVPHYSLLA